MSSGVKSIVQCFSFLWRQLSGAHYFVKTIFQCSYFLHFYHFLMKTIRQCFISCGDNCTSARVDNFTSVDNFTIPLQNRPFLSGISRFESYICDLKELFTHYWHCSGEFVGHSETQNQIFKGVYHIHSCTEATNSSRSWLSQHSQPFLFRLVAVDNGHTIMSELICQLKV